MRQLVETIAQALVDDPFQFGGQIGVHRPHQIAEQLRQDVGGLPLAGTGYRGQELERSVAAAPDMDAGIEDLDFRGCYQAPHDGAHR